MNAKHDEMTLRDKILEKWPLRKESFDRFPSNWFQNWTEKVKLWWNLWAFLRNPLLCCACVQFEDPG